MAVAMARSLFGMICCVLLLAGMAAPSSAEVVLRRGNGGEPSTLDPHKTDGRIESNILRDLFEGLVTTGPDGRLLPGVAESWQISDDGLRYTFKLRGNARWSNGDAITSADILYGFRRALSPEITQDTGTSVAVIAKAEEIIAGKASVDQLGVEAPDASTVAITLRSPAPYFLALLGSDNKALPVHRASVEKNPGDWATPSKMVSNGAYRLAEWVSGKQVTLLRNLSFHSAAEVRIDRVVFYPVANPADELRLFQNGELDLTYEVPQQQVKWISLTQPGEFWNRPFIATYYYALNLTTEPFRGNLRLRQALAMAINREVLVNKVTRAGEAPAYGLVPPTVPAYRHQKLSFAGRPAAENVAEARKLFAESGYGPSTPVKIEILYNTSENNRLIADAISAMWKEAFGKGIEITAVDADRAAYLKRREHRNFQVVRAAWIGDFGDPTVFLNLFRSSARPPRNDPGYRNPRYDALLSKAAETNDVAERSDLLQQAEKMLLDDMAIIPLYHFATKSLVSQKVKGWVFNIRDVHPSRFLSLE